VNVQVHYCLSGRNSVIDSNIISVRIQRFVKLFFCIFESCVNIRLFFRSYLKNRRNMSFQNNKSMAFGNRKPVTND